MFASVCIVLLYVCVLVFLVLTVVRFSQMCKWVSYLLPSCFFYSGSSRTIESMYAQSVVQFTSNFISELDCEFLSFLSHAWSEYMCIFCMRTHRPFGAYIYC